MPRSAGILLFRRGASGPEVFLVHPGGPFWKNKDGGAWSIPKGEINPGEAPEAAACREFQEETGMALAAAARHRVGEDGAVRLIPLGEAVQAGGKRVTAFAIEGELDASAIVSARFSLEWPPRSGRQQSFPEVDRAAWLTLDLAREKLLSGQHVFLERLQDLLAEGGL